MLSKGAAIICQYLIDFGLFSENTRTLVIIPLQQNRDQLVVLRQKPKVADNSRPRGLNHDIDSK